MDDIMFRFRYKIKFQHGMTPSIGCLCLLNIRQTMLETIKSLLIYMLLLFIQGSLRVVVEVKNYWKSKPNVETQADSDLYCKDATDR